MQSVDAEPCSDALFLGTSREGTNKAGFLVLDLDMRLPGDGVRHMHAFTAELL